MMSDPIRAEIAVNKVQMAPIGYVECAARYRYEAPRQAVFGNDNVARIQLHDDPGLRRGLTGLEGFERVWILYLLHLNESWHPMVSPPHREMNKTGVFATRSPHRPNRIAMSCVQLVKVLEDALIVRNHDLLDHTPVLDIKPYIPYADSFPDAGTGWLEEVATEAFEIVILNPAMERARWILDHAGLDVVNFINVQLRFDPTDSERKRTSPIPGNANNHRIAFRTWRIDYRADPTTRRVTVTNIRSGYSTADLDEPEDRHHDKADHRAFIKHWPQ